MYSEYSCSMHEYMTLLFQSYTLQDNILPTSGDYGGILYNTSGNYNYTNKPSHGTTTRKTLDSPPKKYPNIQRKLLPFYLPEDHGMIHYIH